MGKPAEMPKAKAAEAPRFAKPSMPKPAEPPPAYAKPKPKAPEPPKAKPKAKRPEPAEEEIDPDYDRGRLPARIRKAISKFPHYSGPLPPLDEAEDLWTDKELESFFYNGGFIRPNKQKKKTKSKVLPPQALAEHMR